VGKGPSEIIPVPKQMDIRPGRCAWPRRVAVRCESAQAVSLVPAFESELLGGAHDSASEATATVHLVEGRCRPEGYTLDFAEDALTVSAADTAGFRHAFQTARQLVSRPTAALGTVRDWPELRIRGFHLNFESYRGLDCEGALRIIRCAARFKLNTILVEYGPRFPFVAHSEIRDPTSLTGEEIDRLIAEANAQGIRLIPLQQSIAHLEYALRHETSAHLRERPDKANLMCPCHPGSLALFKALATEVIARHRGADWFHLGGDEARKVGQCPRCQAGGDGPGVLYGRHVGTAARWLLERGLRPIVWDDTVCAYPAAFEFLPKETIIAYWDYIAVSDPTPVLIPRMSHVDGGPRVAHDWRWNVKPKRGRVSNVQAQVMKHYSQAARLKSALGDRFLGEFGSYLGNGFPMWIKALPYLEYYQDRGHEVITSPTGMGNGDTVDGVPNFDRFGQNILTHARRCKENAGALGMITTMWYNMPPEVLYQPLIRTAQCAW